MVITNAAENGGDVKALVYVNAFIPDVGENVFTSSVVPVQRSTLPDPTSVLDLAATPDLRRRRRAFLKPSTVHDSFAQDLPEADRWLIAASQRPIALGANIAPTEAAAWKSIPSWAVIGTEDRVIPAATQRDGRASRRDDHRGRRVACVDGFASTGHDRSDPRRGGEHRRVAIPAEPQFRHRAADGRPPRGRNAARVAAGYASSAITAIGGAFTSFGNDVADLFTGIFG